MDVSVEIHCGRCGSANYSMPDGEGDQAPVACNDCGVRLGSIAELKTELLEQAMAHSAEALRKELDRFVQGLSNEAA